MKAIDLEVLTPGEIAASLPDLLALFEAEKYAGVAIVDLYSKRRRVPRKVIRRIDRHIARCAALRSLIEEIAELERVASKSYRITPRWDYVERATTIIARRVAGDVGAQANADAMKCYVRDTFTALGLRIEDPETLYVAIVTAGLLVEMTSNGVDNGQTVPVVLEVVAKVSQTFTAAVLDYLPAEAKGTS